MTNFVSFTDSELNDFIAHLAPTPYRAPATPQEQAAEACRIRNAALHRFQRATRLLTAKSEQLDRITDRIVMRCEGLGYDRAALRQRARYDAWIAMGMGLLRLYTHQAAACEHDYRAALRRYADVFEAVS